MSRFFKIIIILVLLIAAPAMWLGAGKWIPTLWHILLHIFASVGFAVAAILLFIFIFSYIKMAWHHYVQFLICTVVVMASVHLWKLGYGLGVLGILSEILEFFVYSVAISSIALLAIFLIAVVIAILIDIL